MGKAQISIFVIIFILLLLIVLFFVFFTGNDKTSSEFEHQNPLYFLNTCMDSSAQKSLSANLSVLINSDFVKVGSENLFPDYDLIENNIKNLFEKYMFDCLDNFSILKKQGLEGNFTDLNTTLFLNENKLIFSTRLDMNLKKGDEIFIKNNFDIEKNTDIKKKLDFIRNLTNKSLEYPDYFPMYYLFEFANDNGVEYNINVENNIINLRLFFKESNNNYLNPVVVKLK